MNKAEFNDWIKYHSAAFPDTGEWIDKLSQDTLRLWLETLSECDLTDAREATRRMAVGEEPALAAYEREATARRIAEIAKRVRSGRRIAKRQEALPDYGGPKWSIAGALREVGDLRQRGKSLKDAIAAVMKKIPASDNEPRYKCLRCRDGGAVLVWANASIHAALQRAERIPLYRCSIRCDCEANKRWPDSWAEKGKQSSTLPVYDPARFCLFNGYDRLDELKAWCETWRDARVQSMSNYEPSLAPGNW